MYSFLRYFHYFCLLIQWTKGYPNGMKQSTQIAILV
jgi:hypothetical protein